MSKEEGGAAPKFDIAAKDLVEFDRWFSKLPKVGMAAGERLERHLPEPPPPPLAAAGRRHDPVLRSQGAHVTASEAAPPGVATHPPTRPAGHPATLTHTSARPQNYYSVHGEHALLVARQLYKSTAQVTCAGGEASGLPGAPRAPHRAARSRTPAAAALHRAALYLPLSTLPLLHPPSHYLPTPHNCAQA
jgi:hypothetical protein